MTSLSKSECRALAAAFPGKWNREYVYWKLRTDPLYPAASAPLTASDNGVTPVLDIGCGLGLFAAYLRRAGFRGPVHGVDYDARKIRGAQPLAKADDGLSFAHGDVREQLPDFRGHVTVLDVLQYLDAAQQRQLLEHAASLLGPGHCLIIRSGLAEAGWRFRVTRWADWFAHGCFWMKGRPVCYPAKAPLEALLGNQGLQGAFMPLWGRTPFNNYLGVFHKAAGAPVA